MKTEKCPGFKPSSKWERCAVCGAHVAMHAKDPLAEPATPPQPSEAAEGRMLVWPCRCNCHGNVKVPALVALGVKEHATCEECERICNEEREAIEDKAMEFYAEQQTAALRSELAKFQAALQQSGRDFLSEKWRADNAEAELAKVKAELDEALERVDGYGSMCAEAEAELAKVREERDAFRGACAKLGAEIQEKVDELIELRALSRAGGKDET
jgi:hypothetical protein